MQIKALDDKIRLSFTTDGDKQIDVDVPVPEALTLLSADKGPRGHYASPHLTEAIERAKAAAAEIVRRRYDNLDAEMKKLRDLLPADDPRRAAK